MRLFSVFILIFSLSFGGIKESEISSTMQEKINLSLTYLKDNALSKENKAEKIFALFNEIFDFNLMSQLSLANDWKKLNNAQKTEFIQVFEQRLKQSFLDKLDLYTNEEIFVKKLQKPKQNRIILPTTLQNKDKQIDISYKFYLSKNDWLIYDVDILGVSVIQTYRNQIVGFLEKDGFENLIKKLKESQISTDE